MAPITADFTAAWLPLYMEPGDGVALPITLPPGYETGAWTAAVYRDAASSVPIATMGATVLGQVLTVSMTSDAVTALMHRGTSRFAGLWRARRDPVDEEPRTWFKGFFVVDGGLSIPANGSTAVTVTVTEPIVIVTSTAVDLDGVSDADLATAVAGEAALRTAADAAESAARIAADSTLTTNLAAEASTRATADSTEATTRAAADTALSASLTALGNPVDVAHGGTGGTTVALGRDGLGLLSPGTPHFEGAALRAWRAGWAGRKAAPCRVLLLGTSNMQGFYASTEEARQAQILAAILESAAGQRHQVGWFPRHSSTAYLQTWTTSGTVADHSSSGLGYGAVNLTPPAYIETTVTCSRFWISYALGTLIGGFNVYVDGVLQAGPWAGGGSGALVGGLLWDSGPLTRAAHLIRIQAVDGFGFPMRFEGMLVFDGAENTSGSQGTLSQANSQTGSGVTVINGARFGARAGTFAVASGSGPWWSAGLAKLNPCLVIAEFVTNEISAGTTTAQYKADVTAMWTQVLAEYTAASLPPPSLVLRIPHATGANGAAIAPYRVATYEVAATLGAAVLDLSVAFGFVGTPAADVYGVTSAIDGATRVHLSDKGSRMAAELTADYLLRAVGHRGAALETTGLLPTNQLPPITTAEVTDGTLVNADVSASAALALSKLATQAANTFVANVTGGAAVPTAASAAAVKTALAVAVGDLATIASGTVVANTTGGAAAPSAVTISTTLKTALTLVKGDVGLGNVDNTSDANKPVSTATQAALDLKVNLAVATAAHQLLAGTASGTVSALDVAASRLVGRGAAGTVDDLDAAAVKVILALVKGDVGLGLVDNTADSAKPVSTATQTALDLKADKSLSQRTISGTTDTPVLGDAGTRMRTSNAAAVAITVPPASSVAYPSGTVLEWCQGAAGQITLGPGSGVTLNNPGGLKTRAQFSSITAVLTTTTDVWDVIGDTTT